MEEKRYAIFATCGYLPTEAYKKNLEKNIEVWFPDEAEYYGMYLCQGKVETIQQSVMIGKMPHQEENLKTLFSQASLHPDEEDIENGKR